MIGTSTHSSLLAFDDLRLTCHAWFPDPQVAQLLFDASTAPPSTDQLIRLGEYLRARGFSGAVTGALQPNEQRSYEQAGYSTREELYVLCHELSSPLPRGEGMKTRRARGSDMASVIQVDHASFEPAWRLNQQGMDDARNATPRSRFRITKNDGAVTGYAITGRSGHAGYLQRLATSPQFRNQGIGKSLAIDALKWCSRWKVKSVYVNTQLHNEAALHLYRSLGFELLEHRLQIMQVAW